MNSEMLKLFSINKGLAMKVLYNIHSSVANQLIEDISEVAKASKKKGTSLLDSLEGSEAIDSSGSTKDNSVLAKEFMEELKKYTFVNGRKISKIGLLSFKSTYQEISKRPLLMKALGHCLDEIDKIDTPLDLEVSNFDIEDRNTIREEFPKLQFELNIMVKNTGSYLDIDKRLRDSRIRNDLLIDYRKIGYRILYNRLKSKEKPVWRKLWELVL